MRSMRWMLVAASLVVASPVFAGGGDKGDVEIGGYGGYGWPDDYGTAQPAEDLLYGGRLGIFLSRHWSIEGSIQRLPTETDSAGSKVHLDAIRGNLLYNFNPGASVRPFLTAGLGYEKFDYVGYTESSDMGWNAGAGLRWFPTPRWNFRLEGRYVGINVDVLEETQSNIEGMLGLSLLFGGGGGGEVSAAPNGAPTVTCAAERTEILPGEAVTFRATASDPDGDPLSYEWSTSAGRITGAGATANFDFTGATAPAAATVTVKVSDGHGNTATSDCAVALKAAVQKAEAVSCLAGGFPRNLSRLTNVDKACLDDVAQRLQADPRATVTIVGHADGRETSAETISQQRGDAVKAYLVQERSIDGSRITVRSLAATRPIDTATDTAAQARNRRVEVWFVPEGATIPE
jgi:outer membrane protein OmpA-like peptidoglycan-associated protein/opacity protein-like surface antigen